MISKGSSTGNWGWCTLKEYNSVSIESVLSVQIPMTKLTSWIFFSYGSLIFNSFALFKMSSLVNDKTISLPGGNNLKWAFLVVGLEPPKLIYNPATDDCQSNSIIDESWGSHISKNS